MPTAESLSTRVHELGTLLGDVIKDLSGERVFQLVERMRQLSKAIRAGDADAAAEVNVLARALEPQDAYEVAMAFTTYFELVNLAEEDHRTALLRARRNDRSSYKPDLPALKESIDAAIYELKQEGVDAVEMQRLLNQLDIELIFTAHPTESKRRTILSKLRRIADVLAAGPASDMSVLREEIVSLWLTDRTRTTQPEVSDEARTGLYYFNSTLWEVMPRLNHDLVSALARHYPGVQAPQRWLTFGSWIGGDRDGNPNVTPEITAEVLHLHRRAALERLSAAAHALSRELSVSRTRDAITPELDALLQNQAEHTRYARNAIKRYPHEPYRAVLGALHETLDEAHQKTLTQTLYPFNQVQSLQLGPGFALPLPQNNALHEREVNHVLDVVHDSLHAGRARVLADGDLARLREQLSIFGLHALTLDIRQHSSRHEQAVTEVIEKIGEMPSSGLRPHEGHSPKYS